MNTPSQTAIDAARRVDLTVGHFSSIENENAKIIQSAIDAALSEALEPTGERIDTSYISKARHEEQLKQAVAAAISEQAGTIENLNLDRFKLRVEIESQAATIAELQAKVDFALALGLRIDICKSSDCPEGRLAHEYREGSTLARMFDEWSNSIAQAATIERLEAELRNIADATPKKWEMPRDEFLGQFLPWAQNRARHTLRAQLEEKA